MHCLFIHPEFVSRSFWNYRATCELAGARYPAAPLGLITVAAMLPEEWECRLVDCNVQELRAEDVAWADLVFLGGMIAQQTETLRLLDELEAKGKTLVVGGPDATSSPHLYAKADFLVLGEAEVTLPRWLEAFRSGTAERVYAAGEEMADVSTSPLPRFDLLDFDKYLHVGVQLARGCPFVCEFCDIIELFGRIPRLKSPAQMLAELQRLYDLGYRGHVDFVDDNFIGNKRDVKLFLAQLHTWLEEHRWPFEFTTEASINLADDDALLGLMQKTGFFAIFVGIESPDEATLVAAQKRQNTRRSLAESMQKIYSYGIFVNTGYIVGFDTEQGRVADGVLELIEASSAPVNMVGLLFALPNTQLQRRLAEEGRLLPDFEVAAAGAGDQCTAGINFLPKRPQLEILEDYQRIIDESYAPDAYFARVAAVARALDCSQKRLRIPLRHVVRDLRSFARMLWRMGVRSDYRWPFWKTVARLMRTPRSLRYSMALMALYLHFGAFRTYLVAQLTRSIDGSRDLPVPVARAEPSLAR